VRPFRDFGVAGKVVKAAIPARFILSYFSMPLVRGVRAASVHMGPTAFHYSRLTPNFQTYWEPDSDAVNSLDYYEMSLWFTSRGDECLSCDRGAGRMFQSGTPLVIRVRK
jgi:hypothetical protein